MNKMPEQKKTYAKVEPVLNKPVYLRLRFDSPKEMDNSAHPDWGKSFLWGVDEYDQPSKTWIAKSRFSSEKENQTMLNLKLKKGDQYQLIKRADENPETKNIYNYYEIVVGGKVHDTRETEILLEELLPEDLPTLGDIPITDIPPTKESKDPIYEMGLRFEGTANKVWDTAMDYVFKGMDPDEVLSPSDLNKVQTRLKVVEICSAMVNTQVIQNGK